MREFAQVSVRAHRREQFTRSNRRPEPMGAHGRIMIKAYHESRGDRRDIVLYPTRPTAPTLPLRLRRMTIVQIKSDANGNVDIEDRESRSARTWPR